MGGRTVAYGEGHKGGGMRIRRYAGMQAGKVRKPIVILARCILRTDTPHPFVPGGERRGRAGLVTPSRSRHVLGLD